MLFKLCSCAQADLHYCCSLMSKTGLNRGTNDKTQFIMSPPCKGRETYCFPPGVCGSVYLSVCLCVCVCLSVCLSITKSCPLYNLITVTNISAKLHTFVKHI